MNGTETTLYEHAEALGEPLPAAVVAQLEDERTTAQLVADGKRVMAELAAAVATSRRARGAE